MDAKHISLTDWSRILNGQEPAGFYLELLLRVFVVYLILMVAMRLIGKRMSSQLNRTELAALVSLAAAVGVPLLSPERGLVPAVIIAAVVIVVGRSAATLSTRSATVEKAVQGALSILVQDGVLQPSVMERSRITRERLFAHLREDGLHQLGQVQRLYLEANGTFSIFRAPAARPGLSLIPDWDTEFSAELKVRRDRRLCSNCGLLKRDKPQEQACPLCGSTAWVDAVE